jgi:hypothetical protein
MTEYHVFASIAGKILASKRGEQGLIVIITSFELNFQ